MTAWRAVFAFAVLRLSLAPRDVWALSVSEWISLAEATNPAATDFGAVDLEKLVQQYPDETP